MPAYIHHIATEVPEFSYSQQIGLPAHEGWARSPRTRRILDSGLRAIRHREPAQRLRRFPARRRGRALSHPTRRLAGLRPAPRSAMRCMPRASRDMSVSLAARALEECGAFSKEDVTHVVFASCTGFANPGPDYHIVRELGLRESVERYTIGFMGCYAAFPALRMASTICEANPARRGAGDVPGVLQPAPAGVRRAGQHRGQFALRRRRRRARS